MSTDTQEQSARQLAILGGQFTLICTEYNAYEKQIDKGNKTFYFGRQLERLSHRISDIIAEWNSAAADHRLRFKDDGPWATFEDSTDAASKIQEKIFDHLSKTDPPPPQQHVKLEEDKSARNPAIFKPRSLLHDASTAEFRQWQSRFRAYYSMSNMQSTHKYMHKPFMITCVDDTLADLLSLHFPEAGSIYPTEEEPACLMATLENHFNSLHPLHVRLARLAACEPKPHQTASGFFQEFLKLSNDADAPARTAESILVALMTAKCPNKELRTQLLRSPQNLQETLKLATLHDAASKTSSTQSTAATSSKPGKTANKEYGCQKCQMGQPHDPKDCFTRNHPCPICNKLGHSKKTCYQKATDKNPRQKDSKGSANAASDDHNMASPTLLL